MTWDYWLSLLGYLILAASIGLESLGLPIPGEAILLLAGGAVGTGVGQPGWALFAGAIGAVIGDGAAYLFGRRSNRPWPLHRPLSRVSELSRSNDLMAMPTVRETVFGRLVPGARLSVAYLAGSRRADPSRFLAASIVGSALWAGVYGGLGYGVGRNLHLVDAFVRRVGGLWAALLLAAALLLWLNVGWVRGERLFVAGRVGTAWAWWRAGWRRLAREGRRGLLFYSVILLVGGWATGVLVDDWIEREPELYRRDQLATVWLQKGAGDFSPWVAALAWLGDPRFLALVAAATAAQLWRRGRRRISALTLLGFVGALALGWGLQIALQRPAPSATVPTWRLTPYAFPHLPSLLATVTFGWLTYVLVRGEAWSRQVNGATLAIFGVASVGMAGLFHGQANLSDVLAGLSLGVLWLGVPLSLASTEAAAVGVSVRARAETLSPRQRLQLLLALAVPVLILTFIQPPIAQSPTYHQFADSRTLFGVPHFLNVVSNGPFLIVGVLGLLALGRWRRRNGWPAFAAPIEERPYVVLFFAVAVTSVGSAYYHLAPNNTHLVWDRLPMSFGFMSLFAAVIMERIDRRAGLRLLAPLVVLGIGSVVYWYVSELRLHGDLRLYADVQYYPMLVIPLVAVLFRSRYSLASEVYGIILIYAAAKAMELLDRPVYQLLGVVSGHTLKHLLAALATFWILRMLRRRQPLAEAPLASAAESPGAIGGEP